jgi:hypothetical protein
VLLELKELRPDDFVNHFAACDPYLPTQHAFQTFSSAVDKKTAKLC